MASRAGFQWNESGEQVGADGRLLTALYEADPIDFQRRYPGTRLQDSYGDQWPPYCVDLWLKFDWDGRRTDLDLEGFDVLGSLRSSGHTELAERATQLSNDADEDTRMIAMALATVLGVSGPEAPAAEQADP